MCFGGDSGSREPTAEEKALWAMQTRVAEQGLRGREEAMGGYRDFISRGKELGSVANLDNAREQSVSTGLAQAGTLNNMMFAQMASRGMPQSNMGNALIGANVDRAAQLAEGADTAATRQRQLGLQLEGAGYSGMSGFDPSNALSSMSQSVSAQAQRAMQADVAEAQGWGNIASAGMYGLANADKISKGFDTVKGWFGADGGLVPEYAAGGIVRPVELAYGGNVYDQAMQQSASMRPRPRGGAPASGGVDPITAFSTASKLVDKVAGKTVGGAPGGGQLAAADQIAPVGGQAAVDAAAQSGLNAAQAGEALAASTDVAGAAGIDAAAGAAAADAAAAGTAAAAEGAAAAAGGAGALGAVSAAVPWVGGALLLGKALDLFADGGQVKPGIGRNTQRPAGRAANPDGGKVRGPGGPKDDMVPAWLSPGEFVMPVEAVRKYGLDRLESMRQKALNPNGARRQA